MAGLRSSRSAAIAVAVVVLSITGLAVVLAVPDGDGGTQPSKDEQPTVATTDEPTSDSEPLPGFVTYEGAGWRADLPAGAGWGEPDDSELSPGALYRTTVRGPEGSIVLIDFTPREPATFGAKALSRREVAQSAFGSAVEYVFQGGGVVAACESSRCVDFQMNAGPSGPGFAVLGGGADFGSARRIARRVMRSLTPIRESEAQVAPEDSSEDPLPVDEHEQDDTTAVEVAAVDAVCRAARDTYHQRLPNISSDPVAQQVLASNLLSASAGKLRDAGVDRLSAALARKAETGYRYATAMDEGLIAPTDAAGQAYTSAGRAVVAAARDLGAPSCVRLGGL